jgi:hypothetical protein
VSENDLDWEIDRFKVKGDPAKHKTMKDICWAAYNNVPAGLEMGLEAVHYYDPPNFTFPFGIYLCVVDIDRATGETKIRRFYALDDCGTRINPMIIEGQIHGGLTEGFAVAMGQQMPFDAQGNLLGNTLMDYFLPTAVETPHWETDHTVTPSPHHPIGAKGVAESPHVGSIPTFTSAVVDAFAHLGVTDMTCRTAATASVDPLKQLAAGKAIRGARLALVSHAPVWQPTDLQGTPTWKSNSTSGTPLDRPAQAWAVLSRHPRRGRLHARRADHRATRRHALQGHGQEQGRPGGDDLRRRHRGAGPGRRRASGCRCSARAPTRAARRPRWT